MWASVTLLPCGSTIPLQRGAYAGVPGLGPITWSYFGMLLGIPGVKADIMIRRFAARAVDEADVTPERAAKAVASVAGRLGIGAHVLDHAIWSHNALEAGAGQRDHDEARHAHAAWCQM